MLEEAFELVDAEGIDALTMRALGARLGVAPMAIYNHFQDRDAIIDALAPLGVTDMAMPATPERVWRAIAAATAS